MHRALLLPEIVATIVRTEIESDGFLYTCLFINKIFSLEAIRILWEVCGTEDRYKAGHIWGHILPRTEHLARIILKDARRGQFYANFIHNLQFENEGEDSCNLDSARWHKELASVQFPHLEEIHLDPLWGSDDNTGPMNTEDEVLHYAQPNVWYFHLDQGSGLSDSFLDRLNRSCPKLKSLGLNRISECSVSEDGLVRFLEKADSLEALDFWTGLHNSWSSKAFDVIRRYRNLIQLSIPSIQDDWVYALSDAGPVFSNLKHLDTGISDKGLECMARYVPNLETIFLRLRNFPRSHHILASASGFARLRSLTVKFGPQSSLSGHDLVLLAQKCPELTELSISGEDGEEGSCCPSASGITDSIIDEVAEKMTKVQNLTLIFDHPDLLGWKSILSLCRHCKNLHIVESSL